MKKTISVILLFSLCLCLAACGGSGAAKAATPSTSAEQQPAQQTQTVSTPIPAPEPTPVNLQAIVDDLNEEELAQRTKDDPYIGIFEVGKEENTIYYKFAMHIFQYVIAMAKGGDEESLNAYNRLLQSLPQMEKTLENALDETVPDVVVKVILMTSEYSDQVVAVATSGRIVFDLVNGIGEAPVGIASILEPPEIPPELQEKLNEIQSTLERNAAEGEAQAAG